MFRDLSTEEIAQFQQWARDNFDATREPEPYWHPVVRAEWLRLAEISDS